MSGHERFQFHSGMTDMKLIDKLGDHWDSVLDDVQGHVGASISGADLVDYLVRNLGWVCIRTQAGVCEIQCRPSIMSEMSLAELLFVVYDSPESTVFAVDFGLQDKVMQVIRDRDVLTTVLSSLVGLQGHNRFWSGDRFLARPISEATTPFSATSFEIQAIVQATDDLDLAIEHLRHLLNTRFSISSFDESSGDWIELFNSGGFTPFNPRYPERRSGSRLSEYAADPDYMRWVSESRRRVVSAGKAELAAIDAVVNFERVGEARLRYNRLCVPISVRGRTSVLMAAQTDPSIDLRQ